MLQQTVIKAVIPKYINFFKVFPTVFDLAKAEESEVRIACQGLVITEGCFHAQLCEKTD